MTHVTPCSFAELSSQSLDALAQAKVRGIVPSTTGILCYTGDFTACLALSLVIPLRLRTTFEFLCLRLCTLRLVSKLMH